MSPRRTSTSPLNMSSVSLGTRDFATGSAEHGVGVKEMLAFTDHFTDSIFVLYSIILVAIASDSWTSLSISPNSQHFIISVYNSLSIFAFYFNWRYITSNLWCCSLPSVSSPITLSISLVSLVSAPLCPAQMALHRLRFVSSLINCCIAHATMKITKRITDQYIVGIHLRWYRLR